jgi:dipeptidyl aminopeptidase/acylaminoacyl peptidase
MLAAGGATALLTTLPGKLQAASTLPQAPRPVDWARPSALRYVRLSPNGRQICYMTEKDGIKYLYTMDLASENARSINMGNSDVASIDWVDDTHVLVTGLMPARFTIGGWSKGQRMMATVFNLVTGTQNVLFSNMPMFNVFVYDDPIKIRHEGKNQLVALSSKKDRNDDNIHLYRFDLDGTKSWEMDFASNAYGWIITPEGELLARTRYHYQRKRWSVDYRRDGVWKEIYVYEVQRHSPDLICMAANGVDLIVSIPSGGEINDLHQLSSEGVLSAPIVEHGSNRYPTVDPLTYRHNGFTRYDGWVHYEYSDPARADIARKAQAAMGEYRMLIADTGDDPRQTILYSEGPDDAGTYYYVDFATNKPLEIGTCYPHIPLEWITEKQAITYKASDGLDIPAYLTLPPNKDPKQLPLVVCPHGGPASNDGVGIEWVVQALASSGYAILQPNYRGSTRYGEAFIAAGNGEWAGKMLTDLSDGVDHLVKKGIVDARRVGILGTGSYAGYAALASVSLMSGPYNCAMSLAGISDVELYRVTDIGDDASPSYRYFRKLVGEKTDLAAISPARNASKVSVPVMLIHSEQERAIDIQQSRKMASALKSAGKAYEFIEFKAEDNWHLVEKSRMEFINYVTTFLQKHNPA